MKRLSARHIVPAAFAILVVALVCFLFSCDFSALLGGKKDNSGSPANPPSSGGTTIGYVQSYLITMASNPAAGLTSDVTATINSTNISIVLPYAVIQAQTKLAPTITMQSGYTIGTPASFVQTDGMILVVTKTSDASIINYTLHVSVDPNSIAYLHLSSPFYYDTNGVKQDITVNSTLALDPKTNKYTLTLLTDSFNLNYVQYAVQAILSRPMGFASATVPYGTFANLSTVLGGGAMPYSVAVQSPDKTITNTFTISAVRTLSSNVAITDVSATVNYIYDYTVSRAFTDSTLSNFLNAEFNCLLSDGPSTINFNQWLNISNATAFSSINGTNWDGNFVSCTTSPAQAAANVGWWGSLARNGTRRNDYEWQHFY